MKGIRCDDVWLIEVTRYKKWCARHNIKFHQVSMISVISRKDAYSTLGGLDGTLTVWKYGEDKMHKIKRLPKQLEPGKILVVSKHEEADSHLVGKFMAGRKLDDNPEHGIIYLSKMNRFLIRGSCQAIRHRLLDLKKWDRDVLNSQHLRMYDDELRYSREQEFEAREITNVSSMQFNQYMKIGFQRSTLKRKFKGYVTLRSMSDVYLMTEGVVIEHDIKHNRHPDRIIASTRFIKSVLDIAVIHKPVRLDQNSQWATEIFKAEGGSEGILIDRKLLVQNSDYYKKSHISFLIPQKAAKAKRNPRAINT